MCLASPALTSKLEAERRFQVIQGLRSASAPAQKTLACCSALSEIASSCWLHGRAVSSTLCPRAACSEGGLDASSLTALCSAGVWEQVHSGHRHRRPGPGLGLERPGNARPRAQVPHQPPALTDLIALHSVRHCKNWAGLIRSGPCHHA